MGLANDRDGWAGSGQAAEGGGREWFAYSQIRLLNKAQEEKEENSDGQFSFFVYDYT